ncbi:hypothetical protein H6P81_018576 [Aristolochia fimbriata]|uniref:Zinc finger BED domain-containing protein RICESLEEPER 2-like n=1 Tax=Aristolochia fimbriata TaxID=158543 RepID=A0AAV7E5J6_ARIFI|nr:hypothetical protein H6P81_018576 [Aristolochia fimbriata]
MKENLCKRTADEEEDKVAQSKKRKKPSHVQLEFRERQRSLNFQPAESNTDLSVTSPLIDFGVRYDQAKMRVIMAHWILMHEHPFSIVEEQGFNYFMKMANVNYEKISHMVIMKECMKVYEAEKKKLKTILKDINKISLTIDLWKSPIEEKEYMVITGHSIDSNWKLQKRVLGLVHIPPPHQGIDRANAIHNCLKDWEIEDKVFTVSADNGAHNDVCVSILKENLSRDGKLLYGGKLFHVHCCAHILNLLALDILSEIKDIIDNVRESVSFINQSEVTLHTFSETVQQLQLGAKKLVIDCPAHWKSTYVMLSCALQFKDVFLTFQDREPTYACLISVDEWKIVEKVCEILEVFSDIGNVTSEIHFPTSNFFSVEMCRVKEVLHLLSCSENDFFRTMACKMKGTFEKYWEHSSLLIFIALVLDPRVKFGLVEMFFQQIYTEVEARMKINLVRETLFEIYNEYEVMYNVRSSNEASNVGSSSVSTSCKYHSSLRSGWYFKYLKQVDSSKSELDEYLEEGVHICGKTSAYEFDILEWWKSNKLKYRVLSKMAVDILSIPLSTVFPDSTFSAGGRVIDSYLSSLAPNTMQALICGGDWLRILYGVKKIQKPEEKPVEIVLSIT